MAWPLDITGARQCRERRLAGKEVKKRTSSGRLEGAGQVYVSHLTADRDRTGRRQSKTRIHGSHAQVDSPAHVSSPIQESADLRPLGNRWAQGS